MFDLCQNKHEPSTAKDDEGELNVPKRIVYIHIEKTAGTSIRKYLTDIFGFNNMFSFGESPPEISIAYRIAISGHFSYFSLPTSLHDSIFLSVVREPVSRAISLYNYIVRTEQQKMISHPGFNRNSIISTIENCNLFRKSITNWQCQMLSGHQSFEETINHILKRKYVIGVNENIKYVNNYLNNTFGLDKQFEFENVSDVKVSRIPVDVEQLILSLNAQDKKFYDYLYYQKNGLFDTTSTLDWGGIVLSFNKISKINESKKFLGRALGVHDVVSVMQGEFFCLKCEFVNESGMDWGNTDGLLYFSYHWADELGVVVDFEGLRTPFGPFGLDDGASITTIVNVRAPTSIHGLHRLIVTGVRDQHIWFEDKGFLPYITEIHIQLATPAAISVNVDRMYPLDTQARVTLTVSCSDCSDVPKVINAGGVFHESSLLLQLMHDGTRVVAGGYYGEWMQTVIQRLQGHHEPQEELLFHTLIKHVRPGSLMVEFGCFWAYYTNWFLGAIPGAKAICIEPDENNLNVGRQNIALNKRKADFFLAAAGGKYQSNFTFYRESDQKQVSVELWDYPMLADITHTDFIEVLHMDVQGAELPFLQSIAKRVYQGKLRFVVVSTHHGSISGSPTTHRDCLQVLIDLGAVVLSEHSVEESFSGDGLIIASFNSADADIKLPAISRNKPEDSLFGPAPARKVQPISTGKVVTVAARMRPNLENDIELVSTEFGPMSVFKADAVIGTALKHTGSFETHKIGEVVTFLKTNHQFVPEYFFDIGANIGTHLVCALKSGLFVQAVGFEPDPNNFALLARNIVQNDLADKARIFQLALSNRSGATLFELCESNFGDHRVRVEDAMCEVSHGEAQRRVISVLTDRGDYFFAEQQISLTSNCLMWVDTQGHEGHVFDGLKNELASADHTYLVCEFWPYGLERAGGKNMFFDILKGFQKIYDINSANWQHGIGCNLEQLEERYQAMLKDTRADHYPHTDLLCIKSVSRS